VRGTAVVPSWSAAAVAYQVGSFGPLTWISTLAGWCDFANDRASPKLTVIVARRRDFGLPRPAIEP
jgi:hypothetical protein